VLAEAPPQTSGNGGRTIGSKNHYSTSVARVTQRHQLQNVSSTANKN